MKYEQVKKGVVKRVDKRVIGLFIDGTGLDRATRRINRKVDMSALVRGVTSGLPPIVARYYTLIPYEDDSRQHAFLDAVNRAGLSVVVKRLPPKGITRQVSVDIEMAADIVAFSLGHSSFGELSLYKPSEIPSDYNTPALKSSAGLIRGGIIRPGPSGKGKRHAIETPSEEPAATDEENMQEGLESPVSVEQNGKTDAGNSVRRVVTVVCPSRDLSYPISLARELGADTVTADFGQFNTGDILKSAAKWIDLSDSETIWRE